MGEKFYLIITVIIHIHKPRLHVNLILLLNEVAEDFIECNERRSEFLVYFNVHRSQ